MAEKTLRKCYTCKKEKSLDCFHKNANASGGHLYQCKSCVKEYNISYRIKTKKHSQEWHKEYYKINKKRIQVRTKQYRIDNLGIVKAQQAKKFQKNKEKIMLSNKKWRLKNPEKIKVICRRANKKQRQKVEFRIAGSISALIYRALKEDKEGGRWRDRVGYTMIELRQHLESKFIVGMNWGNYGKWHIDHIIPQDFFVFDSVDDVEFRMCWRLDNIIFSLFF